jgi:hypothetical protein
MSDVNDINVDQPPPPGAQGEVPLDEGNCDLTAVPAIASPETDPASKTEMVPPLPASDHDAQKCVENGAKALCPGADMSPGQSNSADEPMRQLNPSAGSAGAGSRGGDNVVPFPSKAEPPGHIARLNDSLARSVILYKAQMIASRLKVPNPLVLANLIALIHCDNFGSDLDEGESEGSAPASNDALKAALGEMKSGAEKVLALAPDNDQMLAALKLKSATSLGRFYEVVEVAALTRPREPGQGNRKPMPSRREALLQGLMFPIVQYVSLYERDCIDGMIDGDPEIRRFFNNLIRMVFDAAGWGGFFSDEEIDDAYFEVGWELFHQQSQEYWEPGDDPYNAMDAEADWLFDGNYLFDGPIAKVDRASFGT